jgi:hypothetical protein
VAPVLPALTDSTDQLDQLLAAIAETGASGVTVLPLHLRPGTREWFAQWLKREHPDLVEGYRAVYARGSCADKPYRRWLAARVDRLVRKHDLMPKGGRDAVGVPGDDEGVWPEGSLPDNVPGPRRVDQAPLTLL